MLNGQILHWLFQILQSVSSIGQVSEFTMEYSTALLMNLSLRELGKEQCNEIKEDLLKVLMDLLYHENPQIRTFINGTLYSLFSYEVLLSIVTLAHPTLRPQPHPTLPGIAGAPPGK